MIMHVRQVTRPALAIVLICSLLAGGFATAADADETPQSVAAEVPSEEIIEPWDFSPYRVLVWVVSDDPRVTSTSLDEPLRAYLDRDFAAVWRVSIAEAPIPVHTGAARDMAALSYDSMVASDPVLAVKRNHKDAIRIRIPANVAQFCSKIHGTRAAVDDLKRRGAEIGNDSLDGVADKLEAIEDDALGLTAKWAEETTEAVLVSRGLAMTLTDPEAKIIAPRIGGLLSQAIDQYDKIFVVRINQATIPHTVSVVEIETLMRYVGAVVTEKFINSDDLPKAVGRGLTRAFSPVVRIDEAGQSTAAGLIRAGGLILKEKSPASVYVNDVLQPMVRKNDRNDKPIMIGPLDWSFLVTEKVERPRVEMGFYSGRTGGLQGRQNKRTFRIALKVKPVGDSTLVRLHAKGDENAPLIGYEFYQKELKSKKMTFIGRTDWDGRLEVEKTADPLRLLYVKNGGAVLARLPVVPGFTPFEVADLVGDDMRLHAEAYIRGVENAIVDLVAIRKLLAARVRLRLYKGEMKEAQELVELLREQPTNERLAADMGKKQAVYLKQLGSRNANQKRKIDDMFTTTREMLAKMITPKDIRELEEDLLKAKKNGGKLAPPEEDEDAVDPTANDVTAGATAESS
jgi:hypothetical protein